MELDEARTAALLDRRTTALATRSASRGAGRRGLGRASQLAEGRLAETRARPFIVWSLGDSLFGTELEAVAAVVPFAGCARVPTRERACLGVVGRAGRFYSVIGMSRLLGLAPGDVRPRHLLLLRGAAPYLALAVDQVLGRFDLAASGLPSDPAMSLEGRLVAPFAPSELRVRLGLSVSGATPKESNLS